MHFDVVLSIYSSMLKKLEESSVDAAVCLRALRVCVCARASGVCVCASGVCVCVGFGGLQGHFTSLHTNIIRTFGIMGTEDMSS